MDNSEDTFLKESAESPNKMFSCQWQGHIVELSSTLKSLFKMRIAEQIDGVSVSDCGTFIVYCFNQNSNYGRILIADADNRILFDKRYPVSVFCCGISSDGRFAIFQLAGGESPDEGKCFLIDVSTGQILWAQITEFCYCIVEFNIDTALGKISMSLPNSGPPLLYDFAGKLINKDVRDQWRLASGEVYAFSEQIELLLKVHDVTERRTLAKPIFDVVKTAWQKQLAEQYHNPDMARAFGEFYEAIEVPDRAIEMYELALSWNPKVGVKRRLQKLKK